MAGMPQDCRSNPSPVPDAGWRKTALFTGLLSCRLRSCSPPATMNDPSTLIMIPTPDAGRLSVIALDTLVSEVHFPRASEPADVAWKALAVNLSDLAAMGAEALSVQAHCEAPGDDAPWLRDVARGLELAAASFAVPVQLRCAAGGTRRVSVQAIGTVPRGAALTRAGAGAGDDLWVSGTLGDAGAGLAIVQQRLHPACGAARERLLARLHRPEPRLALGQALRGLASAAIDVSDGIVGDAGHLARRSGVALRIHAAALPLSAALRGAMDVIAARDLALHAGDDYELLFCAPPLHAPRVRAAAAAAGVAVSLIGTALPGNGITVTDASGRVVPTRPAYQHFSRTGP
jgi:thiamine-monophosphate kinase